MGIKENGQAITVFILMAMLLALGVTCCKKKGAEGLPAEEGTRAIEEGLIEFDGMVKMVQGKYIYIPKARGFDVVVYGELESGDTASLIDKEIRGKGQFSPERPSLLVAKTIDLKQPDGTWKNIFTATGEPLLDDYLDLKAREEFEVLKNLSYDKAEGWEGKERVKVFGKLEKKVIKEGEVEKETYSIVVLDEKNKQVGKILIDNFTDFGLYYIKKLRLFDTFWFYLKVKETVDIKERRKTRELFHADCLFAGLF